MLSRMTRIFEEVRAPLARNASLAATEVIRGAIIDGRLEPGQRLKEEELARELGISRTPVREALLILQTEGLVEAAPNRGATVREYQPEDLDDMYHLRALLEGYAARRAASRVSPGAIARLRESCERFARIEDDDLRELVRENVYFHNTILDVAGSDRLTQMVRKVIELPLVYTSFVWFSEDQLSASRRHHDQITEALARRDADAAEEIMHDHVRQAREFLVAQARLHLETAFTSEGER
jgi:DNA-binding GntR family transcriptional regulator